MSDMTHLSIVDGAFLHLESPEMPMHVGSLALFEPPEAGVERWFEALKAHVASRMHLAPVFTRKLALMPFDLANPVWIQDDDIDLDYHVRYLVLPKPGTMAQLEALSARLHSSLLDRSRPLWEFYVIEGLADGRVGFYSKVHHSAVDGQAAVAMGNSVFDVTPEPRRVRPPRASRTHRYQLGVAELLTAALGNQLRQVVQLARVLPPLAGAALEAARKGWADRRQASGPAARAAGVQSGLARALGRLKLAPPTPFNAPITNQRAFAAVGLPLGEVKAIGKAHGASINDMVMWICSTALREYLRDSRELPEKSLVAGVPISLRAEGDTSSNNQVSGTVIDLATQIADPLKRLQAIQVATRAMKDQMSSFGSLLPKDFPSLGSPWLLSGLASLYGRSRLAGLLRVANVVISNVPGPQVPLYLAGARMAGIYPLSIVTHGIALNITVQSYMGQLCVGLIACRRALPEVKELAGLMGRAMDAARALPLPAEPQAATVESSVEAPLAPAPRSKKPAPVARPRAARAAPAANSATMDPVAPAAPVAPAGRKRPRRAASSAAAA